MKIFALSITTLLAVASQSWADEYYGEFSGDPKGRFVDGTPWQLFILGELFYFDDPNGLRWEVPQGTQINGASIPTAFWSVIGGPFSGKYLKASIVHDHYVTTKERTAHDTHRNFYYGMLANGESKWRAKLMYWAVSTFGEDWVLEKKVTVKSVCDQNAVGATICRDVPEILEVVTTVPGVDLQDPFQLQLAREKFAAIARTLKTSDGEYLDITQAGNVLASEENIFQNSQLTQRAIKTWNEMRSLADLGTLSDWSKVQDGNVPTWTVESSELPVLSDFRASPAADVDAPYVLRGTTDFEALKFEALDLELDEQSQ